MMIDLFYLFKVSVCLAGFYLFYFVFLKDAVYFHANRLYLVLSLGLSFLIPIMTLSSFNWSNDSSLLIFPEIWSENHVFADVSPQTQKTNENIFSLSFLLSGLYWTGVGVMFIRFFLFIGKIVHLILTSEIIKKKGYFLVVNKRINSPCSFFNFIIVPAEKLDDEQFDLIITHECGHINQGHTFDVLLMEIAAVFLWFNPFILLYKKSLRLLHEYLADVQALKRVQMTDYLNALLKATLRQNISGLVSHFNHSTIKKRIQMITIQKYSKLQALTYILVAPLLFLLLFAFSGPELRGAEPPSISPIEKAQLKKISSSYGMRRHPVSKEKKLHRGVDMVAEKGTSVLAPAYGKVLKVATGKLNGNYIIIVHDEHFQTRYNHLESFSIQEGDVVKKGQQIGTVGNTGQSSGPHLHYEVWKDNEPVDPELYF